MTLDVDAASEAINEKVAMPLDMETADAAQGILSIAVTSMSHAVKAVTTERGLNASDFAMVAYGGAGPLHACSVAQEMGIGTVIIPALQAIFQHSECCFLISGMITFDLASHVSQMLIFGPRGCLHWFETEGYREIEKASAATERILVSRGADMRYVGQEHSVTVDLPSHLFANENRAGIKERFDEVHNLRYGTCAPQERSEIVSLRVTVTGMLEKPLLKYCLW